MGEPNVHRVARVVDVVEVVAGPELWRADGQVGRCLEFGEPLHGRRLTFAQVGEHQAQVLLRRVAPNPYARGEGGVLARLLDTLPRAVVHPAVIDTAEAIILDPPRREL